MKNRNWRWLAIGIWLLIILFVWRFTKGIDIAGGVEFVYKIDFTKYKELYKSETDLMAATQKAKLIIESNIRKRVNGLWVGDAEVKLQKVWGDDYVVVRIGWLDDLAKARDIIGKTVELEFSLPNSLTGSANIAARKGLSEDLLQQAIKNPKLMKELGEQGSNDIYYFQITWVNKTQLPPALLENSDLISSLWSGAVLPKLLYGLFQSADPMLSGSNDVNGFFIVKSLWTAAWKAWPLSDQELISKAAAKWYTTIDSFWTTALAPEGEQISLWMYYDANKKSINLDLWEQFNGQAAYQMDLYVPLSGSDKKDYGIVDNNTNLEWLWLSKYVDKKRASSTQLPLLDSLTGLQKNSVKLVSTGGETLVFKIYDVKEASKPLFRSMVVNGVGSIELAKSFIQDVLSNDNYNLDIIFVKDTNSWLAAQDSQKRLLNGAYFKFASVTRDQVWRPSVQIDLDDTGKDIFCKITEVNIQKQMAIFVWGVLVTAPTIQDKICGGSAIINGDYTVDTAKKLADDLNEWALPAKLIQINESKVSATLGENAWRWALWATLLSFVLILLLMTRRYGIKKAIISVISVISFIIVLIGILKIMWYALSLSWMAAIILNIGMWVDAAILVFERLKEEQDKGKREQDAIYEAYERAWPAIFGGQMSTIAIGVLLMLLWSDLFQGFGLVMALNIIILLTVSVPLVKWMLLKTITTQRPDEIIKNKR